MTIDARRQRYCAALEALECGAVVVATMASEHVLTSAAGDRKDTYTQKPKLRMNWLKGQFFGEKSEKRGRTSNYHGGFGDSFSAARGVDSSVDEQVDEDFTTNTGRHESVQIVVTTTDPDGNTSAIIASLGCQP